MLPEAIGTDACRLARRWFLDAILAEGLVRLDRLAAERFAAAETRWPGIWIVDGFRTKTHQADVNPAIPDSLHTRCPSMAADIRVGTPGSAFLDFAGGIWMILGFRWGGTFNNFPNRAHFDIGRT